MGDVKELPRYISHKRVHALEIECFNNDRTQMHPKDAGYGPVAVTPEMFSRYEPRAGDFMVIYRDGYKSFSPRQEFLDGYKREEPDALELGAAARRGSIS